MPFGSSCPMPQIHLIMSAMVLSAFSRMWHSPSSPSITTLTPESKKTYNFVFIWKTVKGTTAQDTTGDVKTLYNADLVYCYFASFVLTCLVRILVDPHMQLYIRKIKIEDSDTG